MNHFTMKFIDKHKRLWADKFFAVSALIGLFLFAGSLLANYGAIEYATLHIGNSVTDILLENLPVINTDIIFSEGALLFVVLTGILLILEPKSIPFTLKSVALFIFIRSVFVTMTHLGPIPNSIITDLGSYQYLNTGSDLFFSGHTGLPFLFALLFWENKSLRWAFLISSVIAAVAVIFGHLHYTIDVFSAYFISYGIFHISQKLFAKDYQFFLHGPFHEKYN